ncbi:MAG: DUF3375 domain-containing protein [Bacteroidetes bacterium]|nr:DUF3375 domain-containing protein [Bacteroidota bacterium]
MNFDKTEVLLKNSPTVKMLRSKNAVLMITFFYNQFKAVNEPEIPNSVLVQKLADYLDELNYKDEEEKIDLSSLNLDSVDRAKKYIEKWTEENYIRNYIDESSKQVINVYTKHTERVFRFLDLLEEREFAPTESKFKDIFNKLKELIDNSTEDPAKKIEELENKKQEIDEEIRKIKREGFVKTYENYQIKSRFEDVTKLANELVGDFKEVEDNFKDIVREVYEKQSNRLLTKGKILQYTFDSLDELKQTDQGKSFYAFWNFMIDDTSQDELKYLVNEVYKILEDRNIEYNEKFLRKVKTLLHLAGRKVLDSNNLVADKLSRVIAEKDSLDRKKARETINEIRNLALQLVDKIPSFEHYISIEGDARIDLPMERKYAGEEEIISEFKEQPNIAANIVDFNSLNRVVNSNHISKVQLLKNVQRFLNDKPSVVLSEVLNEYPVTKGLAEVLGYFSLVPQNEKYFINQEQTEYLQFDFENEKYLKAPQIIFSK